MGSVSMRDSIRFDRYTPLVRQHLRPAVEHARYRWLAWPALAWRVVAPDPRHHRPLDVFQRTVLRLAGAGARRAERVAELLDVAVDFAAHLIGCLHQRGLVDHHGEPTDMGRRALNDDEAARRAPLVSRYVFQCPYSGRLLNRASETLPYAETELPTDDDDRLMLRLGSRGKPRLRRVFFVAPRPCDIRRDAPEPTAVLTALAGDLRARRDHEAAAHGGPERAARLTPSGADRVSIVDDQPQPLLLATWIYLPREADDPRWRVADPFGMGDAYGIRREIAEQAPRFRALRAEIARLTGEHVDAVAEGLDAWATALDLEARARLEAALSAAVAGLPFEGNLLEMERARAEFERRPERVTRAEAAVLEAGKALEHAFGEVVRRWPAARAQVDRLSWQDKRRNGMLLSAIAADVGFTGLMPDRIARTTRGRVLSAVTHGDAALGRQIGAALLAADARPDHPLRALAAEAPEALAQIDALLQARNAAAHARRGESGLTLDALADHIKHTYAVMRALMASMTWG